MSIYTESGLPPARAAALIKRLVEETLEPTFRQQAFVWCAEFLMSDPTRVLEHAISACRTAHPEWFMPQRPMGLIR